MHTYDRHQLHACYTDTERLNSNKERLDNELTAVKENMASLKSVLYGKFGNAINLEE